MDSFENLAKFQRQMARQAVEIQRSLGPVYALQQSIQKNEDIWRNQLREIIGIFEWQRSLSHMLINKLYAESNSWAEIIHQINISQEYLSAIAPSLSVWQESVSRVVDSFARTGLSQLYPMLASCLIMPHEKCSIFIRNALNQLDDNQSVEDNAAISGAIVLAEEQLISGTGLTVELIYEFEDESGVDVTGKTPVVNLFEVQRADLLENSRKITSLSAQELISISPAALMALRARSIVQLALRCNRAAIMTNQEEIFTPTTKYIEAQNQLQWLIVESEEALGLLVDSLYLMLYEGAGKDKLRFLKYLDSNECSIIWIIKTLRNKLLRHDIEHGNKISQRKSWHDLVKSIRALGFNKPPNYPDDFRHLQEVLLLKVEAFLNALYKKLPTI